MIRRFRISPAITRVAAGAAVFVFALSLGAAAAYADPGFVVSESKAGPGDEVNFSISGTEEDATYALEIGGTEVAQGSDTDGSGVSGAFTMPDLGDTSRTVSVEARITQSEDTTTLTRTLQYLAPTRAVAAPGDARPDPPVIETQPGTAPARSHPAPAVPQTPGFQPPTAPGRTRRSHRRRRHASPRARGRLRARPAPRRVRGRQPTRRQRSARAAGSGRSRRSPLAAPGTGRSSAPGRSAGSRSQGSTAEAKSGAASRGGSALQSATLPPTTLLTLPPGTPALFSLAAGVANDGSPGVPLLAVLVAALLCLTALALSAWWLGRDWRAALAPGWALDRDDEDAVLHGSIHVPSLRGTSGKPLFARATSSLRKATSSTPDAYERRPSAAQHSAADDEDDEDDEVLRGSKHVAGSGETAEPPSTARRMK